MCEKWKGGYQVSMWDEWRVADTVDAELVSEGEVIAYRDDDGQESAGEVVTVVERLDGTWDITVDADLDMERTELSFQWDDQIKILVRDYSGVEI
jgi:hypothetical protein